MAKPTSRNPLTICSPLCTPQQVRECCDCLNPDYDLTADIWKASELFYRLTGRQPQYAGSCLNTVRPCAPEDCECSCKGCACCDCDIDYVWLGAGVCSIERVTINGNVVDPREYALSGGKLVRLCGCEWPMCQNLGADASPTNKFDAFDTGIVVSKVSLYRNQDSCYTITFSEPLDYDLFDPTVDVVELVGDDGWRWLLPVVSLEPLNTDSPCNEYTWCPGKLSGAYADVFNAANGWTVTQTTPGTLQPNNTRFSLENARVLTRRYFHDRTVHCEGRTFEITYRTCEPPIEVSRAVAALACEFGLDACGSDKCKLPSRYRSFKLDGDMVTNEDRYRFIMNGLTGVESFDQLVVSLNPKKLSRRARLLSATPAKRSVRRIGR